METWYRIDVYKKTARGFEIVPFFRIDNIQTEFIELKNTLKEKFALPQFKVECFEIRVQSTKVV